MVGVLQFGGGVREQCGCLVEGSRLTHSTLSVRFPVAPSDLDRLISEYRLTWTALLGNPY